MTRRWLVPALIGGALLLLVVAAWAMLRDARRDATAATDRERAAVELVAALRERAAVTDTVYRIDTMRLTQTVTSYVRARETARPRTPTDTAPVARVIVDTLILRADSAIAACQLTVRTCERRVALRDSLAAADLALLRLDYALASAARADRAWKRGLVVGAVTVGALVWVVK